MHEDAAATTSALEGLLQPWYQALGDPAGAQAEVLTRLVQGYARTEYGAQHGASRIETIEDYRRAFPVTTYEAVSYTHLTLPTN